MGLPDQTAKIIRPADQTENNVKNIEKAAMDKGFIGISSNFIDRRSTRKYTNEGWYCPCIIFSHRRG